jgi:hypothetical protein
MMTDMGMLFEWGLIEFGSIQKAGVLSNGVCGLRFAGGVEETVGDLG